MSFFKDSVVIFISILLILSLFGIHYYMEELHNEIKERAPFQNTITGSVIVVTTSDVPLAPAINITKIPLPQPRPQYTDLTLQCLSEGGLTPEDIAIGRNLFTAFSCDTTPSTQAHVTRKGRCISLVIDGQLDNLFCFAGPQPDVRVTIPSGGQAPPAPYTPRKNYAGLILFTIFLIISILVWREFEIRESAMERRHREKIRRGETVTFPEEEIEVKVIKSAPIFKEILAKIEQKLSTEEREQIHKKLLQEQLSIESKERFTTIKQEEIADAVKQFNTLSKEVSEELKNGKLHNARKKYLFLFPLYTKLYNSVPEDQQVQLLDIIKYLHDQMNIMEKSRRIAHLIEKAYSDIQAHDVKAEAQKKYVTPLWKEEQKQETRPPQTPEKQQEENQDLKTVRTLLEGKDYALARNMFLRLGGKLPTQKVYKKELTLYNKQDILDEIHKIHETLEIKHTALPAEDNTTQDTQELQKELEELRLLIEKGEHTASVQKYKKLFTQEKEEEKD